MAVPNPTDTLTEAKACAAFRNFDRVRRRNPVTPTIANLSEAYRFLILLRGWSVDSNMPLSMYHASEY